MARILPVSLIVLLSACPFVIAANPQATPNLEISGPAFLAPLFTNWAGSYPNPQHRTIKYTPSAATLPGDLLGATPGKVLVSTMSLDGTADSSKIVRIPFLIIAVQPVLHISGYSGLPLLLDPEGLNAIIMQRIAYWNDPQLKAHNPLFNLPDLPITLVHQEDKSVEMSALLLYLKNASPQWRAAGMALPPIPWQNSVFATSESGVLDSLRMVDGGLGFLPVAMTVGNLTPIGLTDAEFRPMIPTDSSLMAAASFIDWHDQRFRTASPGGAPAPVAGTINPCLFAGPACIYVARNQPDRDTAQQMLRFLNWCLTDGRRKIVAPGITVIPQRMVATVTSDWTLITSQGSPVWP